MPELMVGEHMIDGGINFSGDDLVPMALLTRVSKVSLIILSWNVCGLGIRRMFSNMKFSSSRQ